MKKYIQSETKTGVLSIHPRGFGFLLTEDKDSHFVPPPVLNGFYVNDRVSATLKQDNQGRSLVESMTLLERTRETVLGRCQKHGKRWKLELDKNLANFSTPLTRAPKDLKQNDWVIAKITDKSTRYLRHYSSDEDSPKFDLDRIACRHGLESQFPKDLLSQTKKLPRSIPKKLIRGRRDLRSLVTVTVDGPSTTDIDDAISIIEADESGGLRLIVSIADVAEFVKVDSALDLEARQRATSVYLIGRVIPMFPRILSENLCSLLPEQDRLALSVEMRIDPEGNVTSVDLYESVIFSDARITYAEANDILLGRQTHKDKNIQYAFNWFRTALARLDLQRRQRGGMENPHIEPKVELDDSGEPSHIVAKRQNHAHRMIERFMVAANEAVADWLSQRGLKTLYRVHPAPDSTRVSEMADICRNFGIEPGLDKTLSSKAMTALVDQVRELPWCPALISVIMRCLGKAYYSTEIAGHFGLASSKYLHFTSPIRRYADLTVHRVVKSYLRGQRNSQPQELDSLSNHIYRRELLSNKAERDHQKIVWARYMSQLENRHFSANVTRVHQHGLFVQLNESRIEGQVAIDKLGLKSVKFDEETLSLKSRKERFVVGTPLTVQLESVDTELGQIEFRRITRRQPNRRRKT